MAVQIPGTTPRILEGGQTGSQAAAGFVTVQTAGARDLARELLRLAARAGEDATKPLTNAAKKAAHQVMDLYKENISDVTGNLRRSVTVRQGRNTYPGTGIAVGGPAHAVAGKEWDVEKKAAGNHAWLVEFGTGRRKAGTQGRRTYLKVHEKINGRFRRIGEGNGTTFNNKQFDNMSRGYYFLMGSKNEEHTERRTGRGAFVKKSDGSTRPYTLGPGDTYGAMPAEHAMQKAIQRGSGPALRTLMAEIQKYIDKRR